MAFNVLTSCRQELNFSQVFRLPGAPDDRFLLNAFKGRTIRKVMGGGRGKNQKKIHARVNAKKKNSCKEEDKEKKFMQKESPIVTFI